MRTSNLAKISVAVGGSLAAMPAWAHPGHLGDAGQGHTHWLALAAGVAAVAVAVITWRVLAVRSADTASRDGS